MDPPEDFLRSVALFEGLSPADLQEIGARLTEVELSAEALLFQEGDPADGLYLVKEGRLAVLTGGPPAPRKVGTIGIGQCVGETALLVVGPRSATVRAEVDSRLLRLAADDFQRALATHDSFQKLLRSLVSRRLPGLRAATTELFGDIDDELRRDVESEMSWVHLARDEILFRQGDVGDAVYVVMQGRLQVVHEGAAGELEVIAEIGRGEPAGEMALLGHEPRSSTVRAVRDSDLLRLSAEGFESVLERNPRAILPVVRTLARRLRATTAAPRLETRMSTVVIVPLGPQPGLHALLPPFLAALREGRSVLFVDAEQFDAAHGPGAAQTPAGHVRSLHLSEWLQKAEAEHDCMVYVADAQPTEWSERCLRQADRVLIVAAADAPPTLGAYETLLRPDRLSAFRELVLLHPDGSRPPSGTAAWLDAVEVHRHHHVRLDSPRDARRLARFVAGTAVGVVLGGGGARGFAHVGVLRALAEAGVPIDFIGGASMGSMPAATYAMGWRDEDVMRAFRKVFVDTTMPTQAYTLPLLSVFSPLRGERAMKRAFSDTLIEDLWLGYFCVASNITRGTLIVQRRGLLWRAMRASGSFPGLLPPVPDRGELLVDGGLLNNLPIDVMQTLCPGPVIASDVSREVELEVDPDLDLSPSAGRMLWSRINPWVPRIHFPGLGPVLLRSVECRDATQKLALREAATWYLAPPIGHFLLTEVARLDEIVEIGYRYTRERLGELPPSIPRSP